MAKNTIHRHGGGAPHVVDLQVFQDLVNERARTLLKVAAGYSARREEDFCLTRPLLSLVHAEATQLEELLDAYGARTNRRWYRFRAGVAALKNFADAGHELLHLDHSVSGYHIACADNQFREDTRRAIDYTAHTVLFTLREWYAEARSLDLELVTEGFRLEDFEENLPLGRLPHDRKGYQKATAASRVVDLATQLLHGTARARFLRNVIHRPADQRAALVGGPISEESLRGMEARFHALQSLYDTHVSDSDKERLDADIRSLRGHISAVLHLLRVGTIFAHFYERHLVPNQEIFSCATGSPFDQHGLLNVLVDYCLGYTWTFLLDARKTCREVLSCYAEVGVIDLPVPAFHGFHVRPSTLVSMIVEHYGSDVTIECGGATYDASVPMELFRANEWINQQKRERVYAAIDALPLADLAARTADPKAVLAEALIRLAGRKVITIHKHSLPLDFIESRPGLSLRDQLQAAVEHLLRDRVVNVDINTTVRVTGDKRVLEDLRVLAAHGYGEDEDGRNQPLPEALAYLNHSRDE